MLGKKPLYGVRAEQLPIRYSGQRAAQFPKKCIQLLVVPDLRW